MKYLVTLVVTSLAVHCTQAWDACGHKMVAVIAYEHLNAAAKGRVAAVLAADPRHRSFLELATWPDDIKANKGNDLEPKAPLDKGWHYSDLPYGSMDNALSVVLKNHDKKPRPGSNNSANVVTAIQFYEGMLSGRTDPVQTADTLAWLIHLVGDVHQPLHCVTVPEGKELPNYAATRDAGGNGFLVKGPARNLHAFWDDQFDESTGNHSGRDRSDEHAREQVKELKSLIESLGVGGSLSPEEWALESYAFHEKVYSPPVDLGSHSQHQMHILTKAYVAWAKEVAQERVALAGLRLAAVLNEIYR